MERKNYDSVFPGTSELTPSPLRTKITQTLKMLKKGWYVDENDEVNKVKDSSG